MNPSQQVYTTQPGAAQEGKRLYAQGQFKEALALFQDAVEKQPQQAALWAHLADCRRQQGALHQALEDFDRALVFKPNYPWALARRGETRRTLQHYTEAIADFSAALNLQPDNPWTLAHRGSCYRFLYRPDEGFVDLNRALQLQPDYAWAMIHRASLHCMHACYRATLADIDRALAIDPNIFPHWHGEKGLVLNAMGRFEESAACCRQGLDHDPHDLIALYSLNIAEVHLKGLENCQNQLQQLQELLESQPDNIQASYRLAGLAAIRGNHREAHQKLQAIIHLDSEPKGLLLHDRAFEPMRNHPTWGPLLEKLSPITQVPFNPGPQSK